MRNLFTILLLFIGFVSYGQNKLPFYYPDGKPYKGEAKNIGQINKELEEFGRVYSVAPNVKSGDALTTVGYKLFTDKPLWILTRDTVNLFRSIEKFNVTQFLASWQFKFELDNYIKKGVLTSDYIYDTLGAPEKKRTLTESPKLEYWTYEFPDIVLIIKEGIVTGYKKD